MAHEFSYRERAERLAGRGDGEVLDVAGIDGIFFCTIPEGAANRAGEVQPFFLVQWMCHFDWTEEMEQVWGGT